MIRTNMKNSSATKDDDGMALKDWGFNNDCCFHCGINTNEIDNLLMQCAMCKRAYYCSIKCFNADLVAHQKTCRTSALNIEPDRLKADIPKWGDKKTTEVESKQKNIEDDKKKVKKEKRKKTGKSSKSSIGSNCSGSSKESFFTAKTSESPPPSVPLDISVKNSPKPVIPTSPEVSKLATKDHKKELIDAGNGSLAELDGRMIDLGEAEMLTGDMSEVTDDGRFLLGDDDGTEGSDDDLLFKKIEETKIHETKKDNTNKNINTSAPKNTTDDSKSKVSYKNDVVSKSNALKFNETPIRNDENDATKDSKVSTSGPKSNLFPNKSEHDSKHKKKIANNIASIRGRQHISNDDNFIQEKSKQDRKLSQNSANRSRSYDDVPKNMISNEYRGKKKENDSDATKSIQIKKESNPKPDTKKSNTLGDDEKNSTNNTPSTAPLGRLPITWIIPSLDDNGDLVHQKIIVKDKIGRAYADLISGKDNKFD